MILEAAVCRQIDAGKKTMIRRPVVGGEQRYRTRRKGVGDGGQSRQLVRPPVPRLGAKWPVKPGRQKDVMCRVKVVAVRVEQHGTITLEDVYREGHRTTVAYKAAWVRSRDQQWVAQAGDEIDPLQDEQLVPRFDARWADRFVYAITFEVDRAGGLYLAADPAAMQTDYVTSPARALRDEPEVNYDREWLENRTNEGEHNLEQHRKQVAVEEAARCELLALHERLRQVSVLAGQFGIDIAKDLFVIQQRIERVEGRLRERPAAA